MSPSTERPLPPPVQVQSESPSGIPNSEDPFNLSTEFQGGDSGHSFETFSNLTEPQPGEPLNPEAEAALGDVAQVIGEESERADSPAMPNGETVPPLLPAIGFSEEKTKKYLVETFEWLAERFDSSHWLLTENQADMLAGPTAELLGGIWTKLSVVLPDALVSFPGATAFLLAFSWVIVPKAAQQMAISRARRTGQNPKATQPGPKGPVAVPRRGEVHAADFVPAVAASGDSDFQVTGE